MTIRIRPKTPKLDKKRLAALLTPALITRPNDDQPRGLAGSGWVQWSDVHAPQSPTGPILD